MGFVLANKRSVGLFLASIAVNAVFLLFAIWGTDKGAVRKADSAPFETVTPIFFEIIEAKDDILQIEEDEPELDLQPEAMEKQAVQLPKPPEDLNQIAKIQVSEYGIQGQLKANKIEAVTAQLPSKPNLPDISERWKVKQSEIILEDQAMGVFLPNIAVGSGEDGQEAIVRRVLGLAACLDIQTAQKASNACPNIGALKRHVAAGEWKGTDLSGYEEMFPISNTIPFVKKEKFDLSEGPLPELITIAPGSRFGGVESGGLPDRHPHAYDDVTR